MTLRPLAVALGLGLSAPVLAAAAERVVDARFVLAPAAR
jgi:hypothetical protein